MAKVIQSSPDEVLAAFVQSDCKLWLIEADPAIQGRDANFVCTLDVSGVSHEYSVVVSKPLARGPSGPERTISFACALAGNPMTMHKDERRVVLSGEGTDIAALDWPETDDPIVKKVAEIAKSRPRVIARTFSAIAFESENGGIGGWVELPKN